MYIDNQMGDTVEKHFSRYREYHGANIMGNMQDLHVFTSAGSYTYILPTLKGYVIYVCMQLGKTYMYIKSSILSAYEMKNNCCLFERLFTIQMNCIFHFGIYFFYFRDIDIVVLCKLGR